jgi:hypothetical protein
MRLGRRPRVGFDERRTKGPQTTKASRSITMNRRRSSPAKASSAQSPLAERPQRTNGSAAGPSQRKKRTQRTRSVFNNFAMSTANLYAGTQPGGFLYGLATTAPINTSLLYSGDRNAFGTPSDPLVGKALGGFVMNNKQALLGRVAM